ncbi:hypothetical protein J3459_008296 [Metarhizium acridum]|nr:hypothetical protein J3459_008296 [Metarhizium acridum]
MELKISANHFNLEISAFSHILSPRCLELGQTAGSARQPPLAREGATQSTFLARHSGITISGMTSSPRLRPILSVLLITLPITLFPLQYWPLSASTYLPRRQVDRTETGSRSLKFSLADQLEPR